MEKIKRIIDELSTAIEATESYPDKPLDGTGPPKLPLNELAHQLLDKLDMEVNEANTRVAKNVLLALHLSSRLREKEPKSEI